MRPHRLPLTTQSAYPAREFARRAGVTVRTLRHYDRLGLLRPSARTESGHGLYSERDVARLQQIVTLRFIGFPLKQIRDLLDRNAVDLPAALRLQREIIEEKRRHLDTAIEAIEKAERAAASSDAPAWDVLTKIIDVITTHNEMAWLKRFYTCALSLALLCYTQGYQTR